MSGIDQYTKLLIQSDDTDGSQVFTDSSPSEHTLAVSNDTEHSATQKKFGSTAIYFDGTNDGLSAGISSDFTFGTGDFTIDFWLHNETGLQYQTVYSNGYLAAGGMMIQLNNQNLYMVIGAAFSPLVGYQLSAATWYHVAFVRSGSTLTLYVDGVLRDTATNSTSILGGWSAFLGYRPSDSTWDYKGYIDEFRISSVARWTNGFTPPDESYSTVTGHTDRIIPSFANIPKSYNVNFMPGFVPAGLIRQNRKGFSKAF